MPENPETPPVITPPAASPAPAAPAENQSPAQPTPKNEPSPRNPAPAKNRVVEKVRSVAARVLTEAGFEFHKGRGRPKNCPACNNRLPEKSACATCRGTGHVPGKLDSAGAGVPIVVAPGAESDDVPRPVAVLPVAAPAIADNSVSALFRRSCVASVKGVLGILKSICGVYANAAGCRPEFTAKTLASAEPDPGALADFTESLEVVMKKRNIQPENAEEWALAINGARLLAPYALLIAEFKGEINRNRQSDHRARELEKAELRREVEKELAGRAAK